MHFSHFLTVVYMAEISFTAAHSFKQSSHPNILASSSFHMLIQTFRFQSQVSPGPLPQLRAIKSAHLGELARCGFLPEYNSALRRMADTEYKLCK